MIIISIMHTLKSTLSLDKHCYDIIYERRFVDTRGSRAEIVSRFIFTVSIY